MSGLKQQQVLFLRFGSEYGFRENYKELNPQKTISEIAAKVRLPRSTVYKIICDYKKTKGNLKSRNRNLIINSVSNVNEQERSLLSILKDPKNLRDWVHISLEGRCEIIK